MPLLFLLDELELAVLLGQVFSEPLRLELFLLELPLNLPETRNEKILDLVGVVPVFLQAVQLLIQLVVHVYHIVFQDIVENFVVLDVFELVHVGVSECFEPGNYVRDELLRMASDYLVHVFALEELVLSLSVVSLLALDLLQLLVYLLLEKVHHKLLVGLQLFDIIRLL